MALQTISRLGRTRNVALKLAHGDYFQFLDADDWLAPEKFESQLEIMEKDKSIGFAYCDFYYYWQDTGKLEPMSSHLAGSLEEDPLPVYWSRWLFPPNAILMRREWVEKVGEFRTDLKWAEDVEYWLRAMAEGCKVRHVPRYLAYYRRHPLSKTALYVASGEAASEVRYHFLKKYPLEAARASYIAFERLRDEIDERDWALYKSGVELNEAKEQIALKEAALINLHEAHREHITQAAYHYKQLEAHYRQLEAKFRDVEKYARSLQDEVAKRANPGPE